MDPRLSLAALLLGLSSFALHASAQETHLWTENGAGDWEKGISQGVAIANDGTLRSGYAVSTVAELSAADLWASASDAQGNAYLATGSPAEVVRVSPDGKQTVLFTTKDLSVQSLVMGSDGMLYAATLPSGKVFRIDPHASAPVDAGKAAVVFDAGETPEKPKYIWAMQFDKAGRLYLGCGGPGIIYRINAPSKPDAKADFFYLSDEPNIRSLLFAPDGDLFAGSDGTGLVYRLHPDGKGSVIYEAAKREITAMALGPQGQLYLAAVGEKGRVNTLPPLPAGASGGGQAITGSITVTVVQPGSTQAVSNNAAIPDGSEVDVIPADPREAPHQLWAAHIDVIYALRDTPDGLLIGTGNRGHVYRLHDNGNVEDVAHADGGQILGFDPAPANAMYLAVANTAKLVKMPLAQPAGATLLSDVFDAAEPSQWGRAEVTGSRYTLEARTGNLDNPLRGWSDWKPVAADAASIGQPDARFAQWRLTIEPGGTVSSVTLNYLPANAAPVVDEILVAPGTRVNAAAVAPQYPQQTVLNFASQGGAGVNVDSNSPAAPLSAIRDKDAVTVRWAAHDDNGDDLTFSVFYRGADEAGWKLLKKDLTDRYLSFDADLLPDGPYRIRIVASDAPSHPAASALTGEKTSDLFLVDTSTPAISNLAASRSSGGLHVTATATDARTPIAHAMYSIDAGPWQYVDPVGRISDALHEQYDFMAPLAAKDSTAAHNVTLRVFDRYDNAVSSEVQVP